MNIRTDLHAEPQFAGLGGFDEPILQGLWSFAAVGNAAIDLRS